jgi:hypothetical protein
MNAMELKLIEQINWSTVKKMSDEIPKARVVYGFSTCWWKIGDPCYQKNGLPCDPRGGVLMETTLADFIESAERDTEKFGKHGLRTFMAAYHGNLVTADNGWPTCFEKWEQYDELVDKIKLD